MHTSEAQSLETDALPVKKRRDIDRAASRERTREAFRAADIRALRAAFYMRLAALAAIAIWLATQTGFPGVLFYWGLLVAFIVIGYAQYAVGRNGRRLPLYALILADCLLLTFTLITDNPTVSSAYPPGQMLHHSRETYYFVLLAGVAACYEPGRVVWAGFSCMLGWTLGVLWLANHPDAVTVLDMGDGVNFEDWLRISSDPYFVDFDRLTQGVILIAIVTTILTMVTYRARYMVRAQIEAARERANLARYFAPAIVEELSRKDDAFDAVRAQSAAVLFADVVGFTAMADGQPPEQVIGFLRALHSRLARAVFDNGGTLDKYMGDGVMAIFGAPSPGPDDACRAIATARAIQTEADAWNAARAEVGFPPVALSVGVHYGPVVTGDIGSERRLEFATIGDAVNLASRLEAATRRVSARIIVSAETANRAAEEDPDRAAELLAGFLEAPQLDLAGHRPVDALALPRGASSAAGIDYAESAGNSASATKA